MVSSSYISFLLGNNDEQLYTLGNAVALFVTYLRYFVFLFLVQFALILLLFFFFSSRRRRSSDNLVFTSDTVHILPDYPKQSPDDPQIALLAFYIQQPQGFSKAAIKKEVLKAIVESDTSRIEESVGGTILSVQPLISTTETTNESDEEPKSKNAIIIGVSVVFVILIVILVALVLRFNGMKR